MSMMDHIKQAYPTDKEKRGLKIDLDKKDTKKLEALVLQRQSAGEAFDRAYTAYQAELARLAADERSMWTDFRKKYSLTAWGGYTAAYDNERECYIIMEADGEPTVFKGLAKK